MTKKELIQFLEPYPDNIQLVYIDNENGETKIAPIEVINKYISLQHRLNIKVGEKYIEL